MSFSVPKTIGEYLKHFADELGARVVEQFPPLHKPGDAPSPLLRKLKRQPFPGQQLAVMGILKKWQERRAVAANCHLKHILAGSATLMVYFTAA
jgi:hypothetical protein